MAGSFPSLGGACGSLLQGQSPRWGRGAGRLGLAVLILGAAARPAAWTAEPADPAAAASDSLPPLGSFHRAVQTDSPEAQRAFDQGLALLYGFNHDESIRAFERATQHDPECAAAWWGIALASCPHINQTEVPPEQIARGAAALARAQQYAARAKPVQQALIAALSQRYADPMPADRAPLDRAYAEAMRSVWADHRDDVDVGVLFAESLMNLRPWDLWSPEGEPRPETPEIIATLEAVLDRDPWHPQALHLYIHAVEASPQPDRAVSEADRLRRRMPGLGHLVHMPSHIDVRVGNWAAAVATNEQAVAADSRYLQGASQPPQFYRVYMAHNHHLLAFAAMMRGQSSLATSAIEAMASQFPAEFAEQNPDRVDGYLSMPWEVWTRFGKWDTILAAPEPPRYLPISRAMRHAARGLAHAAQNRVPEAQAEQAAFLAARKRVPPTFRVGNSPASWVLDVAEHLLAGEVLYRSGKAEEAFDELRQAVTAEDRLVYDEPPDWIQPVRHALGATLLDAGRAAEAEQVYQADLLRHPHNGWSLLGLSESLKALGRADEARLAREAFQRAWRDADVEIGTSCFCQEAQQASAR